MSFVHISLARVQGSGGSIASSASVGTSQAIESSGTSQQSTIACPGGEDPRNLAWQITNGGSTVAGSNLPVYILFGSNPTALVTGAGMRKLLLVGETFYCHCVAANEKVAVINADVTP